MHIYRVQGLQGNVPYSSGQSHLFLATLDTRYVTPSATPGFCLLYTPPKTERSELRSTSMFLATRTCIIYSAVSYGSRMNMPGSVEEDLTET